MQRLFSFRHFGTIRDSIITRLTTHFNPSRLEVINESAGHSSSNATPESHFRIFIVSDKFEKLNRVQRHREIFACIKEEVEKTHAIGITAHSTSEVSSEEGAPKSPPCVGSRADEK